MSPAPRRRNSTSADRRNSFSREGSYGPGPGPHHDHEGHGHAPHEIELHNTSAAAAHTSHPTEIHEV